MPKWREKGSNEIFLPEQLSDGTLRMKVQIIVSTQSASLVDLLDPGDLVVVNRQGGQSVFEHLNEDALTDWLKDIRSESCGRKM